MLATDLRRLASHRFYIPACLALLVLRLVWASYAPLFIDEIVYWDWARWMDWSSLEHPPGVYYLARLSQLFATGNLALRFVLPFLHFVSMVAIGLIAVRIDPKFTTTQLAGVWALAQTVPMLHLGGTLLMPDSGLVPLLLLAAYVALGIEQRQGAKPADAVLLGALLGLATNFKYHAVFIGGGIALYTIKKGVLNPKQRLKFAAIGAIFWGLFSFPVWLWNFQHGFASFVFQFFHGVPGDYFHRQRILETWVGLLVLLGPAFAGFFIWSAFSGVRNLSYAWGSSLWACLLTALSFVGRVKAHWFLPAVWLQLLSARQWMNTSTILSTSLLGVLIGWTAPLLLTQPLMKASLTRFWANLPEETDFFPALVAQVQNDPWITKALPVAGPTHCPEPHAWGSLRWYWVAKLAYHLPGQPRTFSFDHRLSNYDFRDRSVPLEGCPVVIAADGAHVLPEELSKRVIVLHSKELTVPGFESKHVVVLVGTIHRVGGIPDSR